MRIEIPVAKVYGRNPKDVERLLEKKGIDVTLPYLAKVTFDSIFIEQKIQGIE